MKSALVKIAAMAPKGTPTRKALLRLAREIEVPSDWEPKPLPEDHRKLFKSTPRTVKIPMASLSPSKKHDPRSFRPGNYRMWLAMSGDLTPRGPISVADKGNGTFVVLDGNSTYENAKFSRWKSIPAEIVERW